MRIRFIARMMAQGYSGGRLMALGMAEAIAAVGAKVDFLVDNFPEMYQEFHSFSRVKLIRVDFENLSPWVDTYIDLVVVIPGGDVAWHGEWTRHAIECRAKIVLLNFESPNWFNLLSPQKRNPNLWVGWDIVSEHANMILSISAEGNKYAQAYYLQAQPKCLFKYCYPGINTILADQVPFVESREKRIIMFSRFEKHKGVSILDPLVNHDLAGYKLELYLGVGTMPKWTQMNWEKKFRKVEIQFAVKAPISSEEKFALMKSSALLYFPTRFEGFGLPPLEAAYCLLPCACSDLPVLREYGQDALTYADPENIESMHEAVIAALDSHDRVAREHPRVSQIASLTSWSERLNVLFEKLF